MAQPNQLNPNVDRISFRNGSAIITGGTAIGDTAIKADIGDGIAGGSFYISSFGTGSVWVMLTSTWTQLSIS